MIPYFDALPRWARGLALIVAGIAAFLLWLHFHDRAVVREHEADVRAEVEARTSEAAVVASGVAAEIVSKTEKRNDEARQAASGSTDPLRAGLDQLRD